MNDVLGLSLPVFTELHVVISLIAIVAGLVFFGALAGGRWLRLVNTLFLVATILTSVTGFLFPFKGVTPAVTFGIISMVLLAIACLALYGRKLSGGWRRIYLGTMLVAQWLNMVVLVVQSFQKVPALHALAPTGSGPAILVGQGIMFVIVAFFAWKTVIRRPA